MNIFMNMLVNTIFFPFPTMFSNAPSSIITELFCNLLHVKTKSLNYWSVLVIGRNGTQNDPLMIFLHVSYLMSFLVIGVLGLHSTCRLLSSLDKFVAFKVTQYTHQWENKTKWTSNVLRTFTLNPSPDDKIFRLVQIETNCRRHFKVNLKWKISTIQGRKHCEKRKNCLLQAISPFLTMFSTAVYI